MKLILWTSCGQRVNSAAARTVALQPLNLEKGLERARPGANAAVVGTDDDRDRAREPDDEDEVDRRRCLGCRAFSHGRVFFAEVRECEWRTEPETLCETC